MNEGLIPRRYSKALMEYVNPDNATTPDKAAGATRMYELLNRMIHSFDTNPALQRTMANPFVPAADKINLLRTASGLGKSDNDTQFDSLMRLLVTNGRLPMVRDIALAYTDMYRKMMNIVPVQVTTATPFDSETGNRLAELIRRQLGAESLEYTQIVNPDLIGGFTIQAGNRRLDASIADELRQIRLKLLNK